MKKVLFVATVVKKHIMVFHLPYLEWFKNNQFETHVCARNDFEDKSQIAIPFCDTYHDIRFERFPLSMNNINAFFKLRKILKINDYDLIHCHTPIGGFVARLANLSLARRKTKIMYTAHGFHFHSKSSLINWILYYPLETLMSRFTDITITINQEDYELAKAKMKKTKVEYVRGVGIDTRKFNNISFSDIETMKADFGIRNGDSVLLSVGEINTNKNHELILYAIEKLNNPQIKYLICGEGPEKERLISLCEKLNIKNQVKFIGFRKDLEVIYSISDIFVFPSLREGLSVSLMEAMAASLPVVASNIRGNVDLIDDEKGGYLVNNTDLNCYVESIKKLCEDTHDSLLKGRYNKNKVELYDINQVKKEMDIIYRKMI